MTRDIHEFVARLKAGEVEEQEIDLDKETVLLSDGTRLTEELAREIASAVLSRAGRSGGRPSLTGEKSASPQLAFRLGRESMEKLDKLARERGQTRSQLAREAIETLINASRT